MTSICDDLRHEATTLIVRRSRRSSTHPYYLDLRAFKQGRKFFKTKADAEAERLRSPDTFLFDCEPELGQTFPGAKRPSPMQVL